MACISSFCFKEGFTGLPAFLEKIKASVSSLAQKQLPSQTWTQISQFCDFTSEHSIRNILGLLSVSSGRWPQNTWMEIKGSKVDSGHWTINSSSPFFSLSSGAMFGSLSLRGSPEFLTTSIAVRFSLPAPTYLWGSSCGTKLIIRCSHNLIPFARFASVNSLWAVCKLCDTYVQMLCVCRSQWDEGKIPTLFLCLYSRTLIDGMPFWFSMSQ